MGDTKVVQVQTISCTEAYHPFIESARFALPAQCLKDICLDKPVVLASTVDLDAETRAQDKNWTEFLAELSPQERQLVTLLGTPSDNPNDLMNPAAAKKAVAELLAEQMYKTQEYPEMKNQFEAEVAALDDTFRIEARKVVEDMTPSELEAQCRQAHCYKIERRNGFDRRASMEALANHMYLHTRNCLVNKGLYDELAMERLKKIDQLKQKCAEYSVAEVERLLVEQPALFMQTFSETAHGKEYVCMKVLPKGATRVNDDAKVDLYVFVTLDGIGNSW